MEIIEQKEYRGMEIFICKEEEISDPRDDENLCTIYAASDDFNPDDHKIEELMNDSSGYIWKRIYGRQESGLTISLAPFGANDKIIGIIAVTKEKALKHFGRKMIDGQLLSNVNASMEDEILSLDSVLTGFVYRFIIKRNGEIVSTMGNYYGIESISDMYRDAKNTIDTILHRESINLNK